ncbi:MAG: hypothetical protein KF889_05820 [Alphaproteobacteria bacterium]|nr:hypothetical protein [Alphaproteobacteria bacterium]MCW5742388.1 hypothetical protein [Alphaproteobacteria bacterium]
MKALPPFPDLLDVARNTVWFKEPAATLNNPAHFIAYALTYGTPADVKMLRKHVDDDGLREALDHAPPGVFDGRSWTYWNLMMGRYPAPPMPQRRFD